MKSKLNNLLEKLQNDAKPVFEGSKDLNEIRSAVQAVMSSMNDFYNTIIRDKLQVLKKYYQHIATHTLHGFPFDPVTEMFSLCRIRNRRLEDHEKLSLKEKIPEVEFGIFENLGFDSEDKIMISLKNFTVPTIEKIFDWLLSSNITFTFLSNIGLTMCGENHGVKFSWEKAESLLAEERIYGKMDSKMLKNKTALFDPQNYLNYLSLDGQKSCSGFFIRFSLGISKTEQFNSFDFDWLDTKKFNLIVDKNYLNPPTIELK